MGSHGHPLSCNCWQWWLQQQQATAKRDSHTCRLCPSTLCPSGPRRAPTCMRCRRPPGARCMQVAGSSAMAQACGSSGSLLGCCRSGNECRLMWAHERSTCGGGGGRGRLAYTGAQRVGMGGGRGEGTWVAGTECRGAGRSECQASAAAAALNPTLLQPRWHRHKVVVPSHQTQTQTQTQIQIQLSTGG